MKFVALLPVRDEADIIGKCLQHALKWVDTIYVFDTGSVDETWEVVGDFATNDKRIIPMRKEPVYFSEARLRGYMFHVARQQMRDGDWFLRLDADEFHHVAPPDFVKERMRKCETVAYHQYYDFCLTASEVNAWQRCEETVADRSRPIEDRRRYFKPSIYSEPRLCRYRETMQWPNTVHFPFNAGYVAHERLPIRHYPHRDPVQLARRCRLREIMMADSFNRRDWTRPEEHQWSVADWRKLIVSDTDKELRFWAKGTPLPELHFTNHLGNAAKRVAQRLIYSTLVPVIDRVRPRFSENALPQRIPAEIQRQLEQELTETSVAATRFT